LLLLLVKYSYCNSIKNEEKKIMKRNWRIIMGLAALAAILITLSACGGSNGFAANREINVISRETGSGTRGAFIELVGLEVRSADGSVVDTTTSEAYIANGTSIVMSSVLANTYAIGYISLGSLNDTVRAVPIDGVMPSTASVQNGTYPIFRAFNIAVPPGISGLAQDFIDFVLSAEGQEIVAGRYIPVNSNAPAYAGAHGMTGTVVVLGSTSVAPVMEHLKEAYEAINPGVVIEVQSAGSSAGINAARQGTADIGMSSRELSVAELAEVASIPIAYDGLAVIVNVENTVSTLTTEQVRQIFAGETTRWNQVPHND